MGCGMENETDRHLSIFLYKSLNSINKSFSVWVVVERMVQPLQPENLTHRQASASHWGGGDAVPRPPARPRIPAVFKPHYYTPGLLASAYSAARPWAKDLSGRQT